MVLISIFWKIARYLGIVLSSMVMIVALVGLYRLVKSVDPQGDEKSCCIKEELPSVPNGAGLVVTAHTTSCECFPGGVGTYIYVHSAGKSDSRRTLVFRYYEGGIPQGGEPKIAWVGPMTLNIIVDHLGKVTKQLYSIHGVNISYTIGSQEFPPANGFPTWDLYMLGILMIAMLLMAVGAIIFIQRSLRGETKTVNNGTT